MLVMKVCRMLLYLDLKDAIDLGNLFAIKVISSDYRRGIEVIYPLAYRFEDDELYELQKKKRKLRVKWLLGETCIFFVLTTRFNRHCRSTTIKIYLNGLCVFKPISKVMIIMLFDSFLTT